MIFEFINNDNTAAKVTIPLSEANETGYIIKKIDGLGPPEPTLNTSRTTNAILYNGGYSGARLIGIEIIYHELYETVTTLRNKLYKIFNTLSSVKILITTELGLYAIDGIVKDHTPTIFDSQTGATIMVECHNMYFYNPVQSSIMFSGVSGGFEFPFSNESLTEDLIEFGIIKKDAMTQISYEGDVETPVLIRIYANGDNIGDITIARINTQQSMVISIDKIETLTGSRLIEGDEIVINTGLNNSIGINLVRAGVFYNILNSVQRGATWFKMIPGDNIFAVDTTNNKEFLDISINYNTLYKGV